MFPRQTEALPGIAASSAIHIHNHMNKDETKCLSWHAPFEAQEENIRRDKVLTSMNKLGGSRGSSGRKVLALNEPDTKPATRCVEGNPAAGGSPAHHEHVERLDGAGTHQRGPVNLPRRHDGRGIGNLPAHALQGAAGAGVTLRGNERVVHDCSPASPGGGHQRPDGPQPRSRHLLADLPPPPPLTRPPIPGSPCRSRRQLDSASVSDLTYTPQDGVGSRRTDFIGEKDGLKSRLR